MAVVFKRPPPLAPAQKTSVVRHRRFYVLAARLSCEAETSYNLQGWFQLHN
jgi:hypothetical protein